MKAARLYAHDLHNALGVVAGNVQLLSSGVVSVGSLDFVEDIVAAVEAAVRAGGALSLLAREAGNGPVWFDPRSLLQENTDRFGRESGCTTEFRSRIPPLAELEVWCNPHLLDLAFGGLLQQTAGVTEMPQPLLVRCGIVRMTRDEEQSLERFAERELHWFRLSISRHATDDGHSTTSRQGAVSLLRRAAAGWGVATDLVAESGGRLWLSGRGNATGRTVHLWLPSHFAVRTVADRSGGSANAVKRQPCPATATATEADADADSKAFPE